MNLKKMFLRMASVASLIVGIYAIPTFASEAPPLANIYGEVVCNGVLNVRALDSMDSNVVYTIQKGATVDILDLGKWVNIRLQNGVEGYVLSDYLAVRKGNGLPIGSSLGDQISEYAKQFLGTPYVYGATNLRSGVDCSGFVYAVFRDFDIYLNRSSRGMAANGVPVERNQLLPGDLVLFDSTGNVNMGNISHVGIYIGNGQYIHSSSGKVKGVIISNLSESYSARTYVTARRVVNS